MKTEKGSAVDQVYSYIFHKIQVRELLPGSRINIEKLSRELGVSRTPIREALSRLIQDGYAEQKYNAGVRVVNFTPDVVFEALEANTKLFNIVFDGFIERGIPAEMLEELEEIIENQKKAIQENDLEQFHIFSLLFHNCIIDHCSNSVIRAYTGTTQRQINLSATVYLAEIEHRQRCFDEHVEILMLLKAGDAKQAKVSMERHNLYPMQILREAEEEKQK